MRKQGIKTKAGLGLRPRKQATVCVLQTGLGESRPRDPEGWELQGVLARLGCGRGRGAGRWAGGGVTGARRGRVSGRRSGGGPGRGTEGSPGTAEGRGRTWALEEGLGACGAGKRGLGPGAPDRPPREARRRRGAVAGGGGREGRAWSSGLGEEDPGSPLDPEETLRRGSLAVPVGAERGVPVAQQRGPVGSGRGREPGQRSQAAPRSPGPARRRRRRPHIRQERRPEPAAAAANADNTSDAARPGACRPGARRRRRRLFSRTLRHRCFASGTARQHVRRPERPLLPPAPAPPRAGPECPHPRQPQPRGAGSAHPPLPARGSRPERPPRSSRAGGRGWREVRASGRCGRRAVGDEVPRRVPGRPRAADSPVLTLLSHVGRGGREGGP